MSIFLLHFSFPDSSAYRCRKRQAKSAAPEKKSENLLVDIQAKLRAGKGAGYARWATLFNLKQMAQTVAYLQENELLDYTTLAEKAEATSARFSGLSTKIKSEETRMTEIAVLRKHIVGYAKTRDTYAAYRKAGYSKKFLAEHESEIALHKAAKHHFDELGGKKLSTIKALNTEYAALMAEKNYFCLLTGNRSVTIIGVTEWLPARRNIMAGDTKERILETALELFAQNGYLGTSMNDIAKQLGFTKAALYKHYTSKQEILDRIVERMNEMDYERAESYEMPETEPDGFAEAYLHTPISKIRAYSTAQFDHWTKEPFSSNFRKMLTLEQYRDPKLAQLHHNYLAGGPLKYMAAIFRKLTDTDEAAMQLALEFYGPMYLLYSVYDGAQDKDSVAPLLDAHIEQFIAKVESCCRKDRETI